MMRAHSSPGPARAWLLALFGIAALALPGTAAAMRVPGGLSPRLAKLASPALRDAPPARQARALSLSPDGLARRGRRVLASVRFDQGALGARDELREVGAEVIGTAGRYQLVTVAALPDQLRAIARLRGVEGVSPVFSPVAAAAATCPSGSIVSEGDTQLKAKAAREANPGVDGSGVEVGILSDSFDQAEESEEGGPIATKAADDVKSADLPGLGNECGQTTPVDVLEEEENAGGASDEGRGMAQIVHDLAPGAELGFASAFNGEPSFAANIKALVAAGADVIADDVFYPEEPFFQDGMVAVAVKKVVEEGVSYFSAAGNDNLIDAEGNDIGSWETPEYRDAGSCPPSVRTLSGANPNHCLDFNPGAAVDKTFGIKVEAGETLSVDLQWDEPWFGVDTDLDAFLLNSTGGLIKQSIEGNAGPSGTQMPVEMLEWTNSSSATRTVQLVVNRFSGGNPRLKFALIENGGGVEATEYPRSSGEDVVGPTIFGHSGSAAAISVAAVRSTTLAGPERFSSRGPVRHDFGPIVDETAATQLASPEVLSKPDLTATDCVRTTFFAFFDEEEFFPVPGWYFCGTSAAAPHAAAVAALMRQAEPAAGPEEVREAMVGSAAHTFNPQFGPCDVGAGLVEAVGAIEAVIAETGGTSPFCELPEPVDPEEAAAPGEWGSETPPPPPPPPSGGGSSQPGPGPNEPQPPVTPQPPRTIIAQHPLKVLRTSGGRALAVFRFRSDESKVSFVCRIDGAPFRPCPVRLARRFPPGPHLIEVAARNAEGIGDPTPARYRFRVRTVR